MDPISIAAKYLIKKVAKEAIYQLTEGMSPKAYFKLRLKLSIDIYEREHKVTDELLDIIVGSSSNNLEKVANDAGISSFIDMVISKKNLANDFFESPVYKFLENFEFNTLELGEFLSQKELDNFFNLAKRLLASLV